MEIKTDAEYQAALKRIKAIWPAPKRKCAVRKRKELRELLDALEDYEDRMD